MQSAIKNIPLKFEIFIMKAVFSTVKMLCTSTHMKTILSHLKYDLNIILFFILFFSYMKSFDPFSIKLGNVHYYCPICSCCNFSPLKLLKELLSKIALVSLLVCPQLQQRKGAHRPINKGNRSEKLFCFLSAKRCYRSDVG